MFKQPRPSHCRTKLKISENQVIELQTVVLELSLIFIIYLIKIKELVQSIELVARNVTTEDVVTPFLIGKFYVLGKK